VTVTYSGQDTEIFLNGELDAFRTWSGPLLQTSIDLMVGQMLPSNSSYNFRGVLDEVRLYDYQLSVPEILELAGRVTGIRGGTGNLPAEIQLLQNYPNPFNPGTTIRFALPVAADVQLAVYDLLGRKVASLLDEKRNPGWHSVVWDARGHASGVYLYRLRVERSFRTGMMVLMK
jgi:hypothetical protein